MSMVMLFVTLMVAVPFVWFVWAERSGMSKKKKAFEAIANSQNIKFTLKETWNNSCLGFNEDERTLLYINLTKAETEVQKIELEDVRKCVINKVSKEYKNNDKHYSEMSRLDLEFTFVTNTNPVVITLFNADDNFSQDGEIARAEKWLALIDKHKYSRNTIVAA